MIDIEYLREEMRKNGIKSKDLAEKTGVTTSMISKILNGVKTPGLSLAIGLIKSLDLDANKFLEI